MYLPNTKANKCIFRYFGILWNHFMYRDHFIGALSLWFSELFILVASKDLQLSLAQWELHKSETEPSSFISNQNRTEPYRIGWRRTEPAAQSTEWLLNAVRRYEHQANKCAHTDTQIVHTHIHTLTHIHTHMHTEHNACEETVRIELSCGYTR